MPGNFSNVELFTESYEYEDPKTKLPKKSAIVTFDPAKRGNVFSYCNLGFVLAEDMMSLVADSEQGYYGELQNRITNPQNSLGLKHTKSIYESDESKKAASEVVKIKGAMYDWGVKSEETVELDPLKTTQKGSIALSEGGLCSSVGDLETFYTELSKLACGIPNLLQTDPAKTREIHGFYLDAYKAGEKCKSDSNRELSVYCANHYSLGVIIEAVDEKGNVIPARGNEGKTQIRFNHLGNQPGNDAAVSATMPFSFAEFTSGTADLKKGASPKLDASISQKDVLAKDSLLTIVNCDYIAEIDKYFSSKCDKKTDKHYNDVDDEGYNWRTYNQYWEAARTGKPVAQAWQAALTDGDRLPSNFSEFHDEICAAYAPANEALATYFKEHFCNEDGVVDRAKVKEKLKTAADFEAVKKDMGIEPLLQTAREKTQEIFAKSDEQLRLETLERQNKIKLSKAVATSFVEAFADKMQPDDERSFVERLNLKPTDHKSRVTSERLSDSGSTPPPH